MTKRPEGPAPDLTAPIFADEDATRAHSEGLRRPDGPVCPRVAATGGVRLLEGKSRRSGLR